MHDAAKTSALRDAARREGIWSLLDERGLHLGDPFAAEAGGVGGEVAAVVPIRPAEAALLGFPARGASPASARVRVGVDARAELAQVDAQAGAFGEGVRQLHLLD